MKNVLFEKNSAAQQGGGLVATDTFQYGTTVTMDRNTRFVDNEAIVGNKDTYISKAGFTFLDCQPGYFSSENLGSLNENFNSDGKAGCLSPCPPGHFGQGVATREEQESCPACTLGHSCPDSGTADPVICPIGYFCKPSKAGEGIFYARPCPAGKFGETQGLSSEACTGPCPVGHKCPAGTATPVACESGTFAKDLGDFICKDCPVGWSTPVANKNAGGAGTCEICVAGKFNSKSRSNACPACPAGWKQEVEGQSACTKCESNTYSDSDLGVATCTPCQLGKSSESGSTKCQSCEAGMYSNVVGQACQKCATGTYRRSSMTPELCEACGVGSYQNEEGQASWCVACCFHCGCWCLFL